MKEKNLLIDFAKALVETPLTIIFIVLDVLGVIAVIHWVIDDFQEATVFLIIIIVIFGGQYLVFRRIRLQLASFEQAKPHIEFSKVRQAQMYHPSPIAEGRMPTYEVLQVWFRNNPSLPLETSIAKDVTALVGITKSDSSELFEFHSQWAKSNAPDNVGYDSFHDTGYIQPGHLEAKLIIALKYPSDSLCYAFTRESLRSSADGRSPRYEITPGDYSVRIHLRVVGVDEVFRFALHNYGINQSLNLEPESS